MSSTTPDPKPTFWLKATSSDGALPELVVKAAIIEEALSELTRMRIEFLCRDRSLSLRGLLGQQVTLGYAEPGADLRQFHGLCVQAEYIGTHQGMARFVMEVRPRFWFLTRQADCKVFQGKTTSAIVQEVTQEDGFSSNLKLTLSASYDPRPYCIQYRETDFAFISRLMEEEGIYYYFTHDGSAETMVLADSPGQHKPLPGGPKLEYVEAEVVEFEHRDQVFEWQALDQATTGEVSLVSYNFETPDQSLLVKRSIPFGAHPHVGAERYDNEGRYLTSGAGVARA
ncbi:MAG: type VI secretion system tip protein TssI/VgrG, partial [Gemmobacter sp.]|nr:type VI secretion system tip protein TssI/VgrG [Gemmobacter sp.]